jgi:integrase
MVQLHLASGMRPGEVFKMRLRDIDRTGEVWAYRPFTHKTKKRGKQRVVFLGPQAQQALAEHLAVEGALGPDDYVFSPRRWTERQLAERTAKRTSRRQPSQLRRRPKADPKRRPGEKYTRWSYRQAIKRACKRAKVPHWTPLQVRHTTGTALRAKYGVEAAKTVLGHSRVETSQIYAERDLAKAAEIMKNEG